MAEVDWTFIGADAATIRRGVTAAFTPPPANATNKFVFGFHSQVDSAAQSAMYLNKTNFAPLKNDAGSATGGVIQAALQRAPSTYTTGFSIGMFMCLQGTDVGQYAYVLGLSDNYPHEVVLAKCTLKADLKVDASYVLKKGSATYNPGTWVHLRLEVIVNPNGDVVLRALQNDLNSNKVDSPSWQSISGIDDFIDDSLGINAASTGHPQPLAGGYAGVFFSSTKSGCRALVDHVVVMRQKT